MVAEDIPCVIEGVSGHKECVGVVEPGSKFSERYSVGALRTAVTVKDGRIPVFKIYHCSSVGDLHPLMGGDKLPDEGVSEGYKVVTGAKENFKVEKRARQCSAVFVETLRLIMFLSKKCFP